MEALTEIPLSIQAEEIMLRTFPQGLKESTLTWQLPLCFICELPLPEDEAGIETSYKWTNRPKPVTLRNRQRCWEDNPKDVALQLMKIRTAK